MIKWVLSVSLLLTVLSSTGLSQNYNQSNPNQPPPSNVPGLPDEYKDFRWHRLETQNFEILAIDREHAIQIAARCEQLKTWIQNRWGLADIPYNRKCMILCIKDRETFKKWFRQANIDPKIAKSKNADGSTREVYAIWIHGEDGFLTQLLPEKIGRVNLINYELQYNIKVPRWMHIGMSALNNDVNAVRVMLGEIQSPMNLSQIVASNAVDADFRANAAAACLMLRRTLGDRFIDFMKYVVSSSKDQAIINVGFQSASYLDQIQLQYTKNLIYDIRSGITPNAGLTWFVSKRQ